MFYIYFLIIKVFTSNSWLPSEQSSLLGLACTVHLCSLFLCLLNFLFEITVTLLDLADILLDISFHFQSIVIQQHARSFLNFSFDFFDSALFDLCS